MYRYNYHVYNYHVCNYHGVLNASVITHLAPDKHFTSFVDTLQRQSVISDKTLTVCKDIWLNLVACSSKSTSFTPCIAGIINIRPSICMRPSVAHCAVREEFENCIYFLENFSTINVNYNKQRACLRDENFENINFMYTPE